MCHWLPTGWSSTDYSIYMWSGIYSARERQMQWYAYIYEATKRLRCAVRLWQITQFMCIENAGEPFDIRSRFWKAWIISEVVGNQDNLPNLHSRREYATNLGQMCTCQDRISTLDSGTGSCRPIDWWTPAGTYLTSCKMQWIPPWVTMNYQKP